MKSAVYRRRATLQVPAACAGDVARRVFYFTLVYGVACPNQVFVATDCK